MGRRSQEFILQLLLEHKNGASLVELNKKYCTDAGYQFKQYGIKARTSGEQRIISRSNCIKLNWRCEDITNEYEAYILGMLFADGWRCKNQLGLRLKTADKYLVEKIRDYFSKDIKIINEGASCLLIVSSAAVVRNLEKYGFTTKKTKTEFSMPNISSNLCRHFIRGYFDGDGSIYICNRYSNNPYLKGYICSPTLKILQDFQKIFSENNIESTINTEKRKGKTMFCVNHEIIASSDMHRLFIRKKKALQTLYNFLYDDASIFLERKKKIFDDNIQFLQYSR